MRWRGRVSRRYRDAVLGPPRDPVDRAHLRDPSDAPYVIARAEVAADLHDLARRFWIPTWDVPVGREAPQHVLQYPVCLLVVSNTYARFYGVTSGLSTTTLTGRGWAVGLMFQPAAGFLLTGRSVSEFTDRYVDLGATGGPADALADLVRPLRECMGPEPTDPAAQAEARSLVEDALRRYLPVDDEGRLVNDLAAQVEADPDLLRVTQLCERFGLTERSLQRLTERRLGLGPKWLIRRRRLHEATARLQDPSADLAALAHDLGYADQAHFTRDFRRSTGLTPGEFGRRFR